MSKRKTVRPAKCIITMGEKLTQTQYVGKVSGINLINAVIHLLTDIKETTGTPEKITLGTIAEMYGYKLTKREKE